MTVTIDGKSLTLEQVVRVARYNEDVELAETAYDCINRSRELVERIVAEKRSVYGVNTGFGLLSNVSITDEEIN